MARYIDADKLIAHLKDEIKECEIPFGSRANGKSIAYGTALGLKSAISFVETLSTADVVPKSEVSILTVQNMALEYAKNELQHELNKYKGVENILNDNMAELIKAAIDGAKAEVASEIFAEIEMILKVVCFPHTTPDGNVSTIRSKWWSMDPKDFAELKKKYTEEHDGNSN